MKKTNVKKRHQNQQFASSEDVSFPKEGNWYCLQDGSYCIPSDDIKARYRDGNIQSTKGMKIFDVFMPGATKPEINVVATCPLCHEKPKQRGLISGAAKLFDFGGALGLAGLFSEDQNEADFNALKADWNAVGTDLYNAMIVYDRAKNK